MVGTLRAVVIAGGLLIAVASALVDRPDVFALVMPASLVLVVVGAGLVASDAIPVRRWPLAASSLAVAAGATVAARAERPLAIALGLAVAAAQAAAWRRERRYSAVTAATTRVERDSPPASSSAVPSETASASGPRDTHGSTPSP
jgi:hypothetical protein